MYTLIIARNYARARDISRVMNIPKNYYRYLCSGTSAKDIMNSTSIKGFRFDRVVYDGEKPNDEFLAYLSISMRDGAILTNFRYYLLQKTLNNL